MKVSKIIFIYVFFVLAIAFTFFFSYFISQKQSPQTIKSQAQTVDFCQDKCIGQDRCGPNGPPGDPNYNAPCCEEIKRTGDPFACDWPQRGYCTDEQCASIPEGVNRQRCGGPRHSWCNMCRDAKCPGYVDTTPTPTPYQLTPTQPALPTKTPTPSKHLPAPTSVFPTTIIPFLPTEQPQPSIVIPSPFEFPSLNLPKIEIDFNQVNAVIQKPLGLFEFLLERVKYYDRQLENTINNQIKNILRVL